VVGLELVETEAPVPAAVSLAFLGLALLRLPAGCCMRRII